MTSKSKKNAEKVLNKAGDLLDKLVKTTKCIERDCAKEKQQSEANTKKYMKDIEKINKQLKERKISKPDAMAKISDITIEMYKQKQRVNLVKCQVAKCKRETKEMVLASLDVYLKMFKQNKKHPVYIFANKYKKMLKENITFENMQKLDIEFQEINHYLF